MIGSTKNLSAQNKDFWFAAPDCSEIHDDRPVFFMVTAGELPAVVTISIPANEYNAITNPTGFVTKTVSLKPYESHKFLYGYRTTSSSQAEIDQAAAEMALIENSIYDSGIPTNRGIHITATSAISAYYQIDGNVKGASVTGNQKDFFALKGTKALGKKFYIPSVTDYFAINNYMSDAYRQVQIVAVNDGTVVTFKPTVDIAIGTTGTVYAAGGTYNITLSKGQTLLLRKNSRDLGNAATGTLSGTSVESTKDIAITVFEDCLYSNGNIDPAGDQIVPVNNLGTSYVIVKGFSTSPTTDHVYILATEDGTTISKDGVSTGITLNAGQSYSFNLGVGAAAPLANYFVTNKPVYCYHQSSVGGELDAALIPSMYSISSRSVSFMNTSLGGKNAVILVYRATAESGFTIKQGIMGSETPMSISGTATLDGWKYVKWDIPAAYKRDSVITIANKTGAFSLGYFTGSGSTALYGYLSNFGSFSLGGPTTYACGTSHLFDGGYAKNYKWTDPYGTITTNSTLNATKSGRYIATVNQDPDQITDTTYLKLQNFNIDTESFPTGAFPNDEMDFSIKLKTTSPTDFQVGDNVFNVKYEWTFSDDVSGTPATVTFDNLQNGTEIKVPNVKWGTPGRKTISLKISNLDAGCDTLIKRNVIIFDYPDNISDATCYIDPEATNFTISTPLDFGNDLVNSMSTPLVADLDGDGTPEIIAPRVITGGNPWESNGFVIVNVKNNTTRTITTANFATHGQSVVIADVDKDGTCEIYLQATDGKIYCYTPFGGILKPGFTTTTSLGAHYIVQLADLNNDGNPELVAGPYIFNAKTGKLLLQMTFEADGTGYGNPHGLAAGNGTGHYFMPAIGDVDGDGYLEIVGGSTVYKPIIVANSNSTTGNSYTITKVNATGVPAAFKSYLDGPTVLVDFDLDGQLDVCVTGYQLTKTTSGVASKAQFYVWNPRTRAIIAYAPELPASFFTIPYVGDLDGNGYPDYAFASNNGAVGMISYQYNNTKPGNINVGSNKPAFAETAGFTMFDFNQDGKSEIVYRGTSTFYIVDGTTLNNVSTPTSAFSGTIAEYPIVADVDGDGQAEIILTRAPVAWNGYNCQGMVSVYKTGDSTKPWAPARSVWNQWNYNAVNIKEDMTIPIFQFAPSMVFPGTDGVLGTTDDVRPFNGMLQQQTLLSKNGTLIFPTPDPQIVNPTTVTFTYDNVTKKMTVGNLQIKNVGSVPLRAPIKISTYKNTVATGNLINTYSYTANDIPVNGTITISFVISNFDTHLPVSSLLIKVNDNGAAANDQPACNECTPKSSDSFGDVDFDALGSVSPYKNCVGGTATFTATPSLGGTVTYKWFAPGNTTTPISTASTFTKTPLALTDGGQYVIEAKVNGDLTVSNTLPYLSVAPTTMYWKGTVDNDWNNINNWASNATGTALKAIPAPCTTVHIPGGLTKYPSLDASTTLKNIYGDATVDNIIFHYKSELAYQHKLSYNKAYVQYNFGYYNGTLVNGQPGSNGDATSSPVLKRGSWYTLAAPLKNMASGDFSMAGYPLTWQAEHSIASGGTNGLVTTSNKSFAKNDVNLNSVYNSIGFRVAEYNNANVGYNNHKYLEGLRGVIQLPSFMESSADKYPGQSYDIYSGKSTFYYFDTKTLQQLASPVGSIKRGNEAFRFVYENGTTNAADKYTIGGVQVPAYKLPVVAQSNKKVMIGNPFLASINSEHFADANASVIDKSAGYLTYSNATQTWVTRTYSSTNNINSFQSFIVTLKGTSGDLYFPLEGSLALTGPSFAGNTPLRLGRSLYVTATNKEGIGGQSAILTSEEASGIESNINKVVSLDGHATPEVFFIGKSEADYNLIQLLNDDVQEIGLGVKCSDTDNTLTMEFDNIEDFVSVSERPLFLVDKLLQTKQDLTKNSTYNFIQSKVDESSQYIDMNRFVLSFAENGTIDNMGDGDDITIIYTNEGHLKVVANQGLDQVQIYNLVGQLVYETGQLAKIQIYEKNLTIGQGVYIVKAKASSGKSSTKKIAVN